MNNTVIDTAAWSHAPVMRTGMPAAALRAFAQSGADSLSERPTP